MISQVSFTGRLAVTLSNQSITWTSRHGNGRPPQDQGRSRLPGQIQLWNHIRWNQEEYGITCAANTGYK